MPLDAIQAALLARVTARASLVVFGAWMLARRWSRAGRPGLFAAFVGAHTVHFGAVLLLAAVTAGHSIEERGGWLAHLVVGALFYGAAWTIFHVERPAAFGASVSTGASRTHAIAPWIIWIVFAQANIPRALWSPLFGPLSAWLIAAAAVYALTATSCPARRGRPRRDPLATWRCGSGNPR